MPGIIFKTTDLMNRVFLTGLLIAFSFVSQSQGFINRSRGKCASYLRNNDAKNNITTIINESDSTIIWTIADSLTSSSALTLHFDEHGKCDEEIRMFSCDSCFQKDLNKVLDYKKMEWTKLDASSYISTFSKKLLLRINAGINYTYIIRRFDMDRQHYNLLSKQNDFKEWKIDSPLIWKDFKGNEPLSSYSAHTELTIIQVQQDSLRRKIYAILDRSLSWFQNSEQGTTLLKHEQYHFNIEEVFARIIRQGFILRKLKLFSYEAEAFVNEKLKECSKMQAEYDKGSNHSKNKEEQAKWEEYIDKQLKKLGAYTNPIF